MIVYGDRSRAIAPGEALTEISRSLASSTRATLRPERLDHLTCALTLAGELTQGLADALFERRGCDDPCPVQDAAMALARAVAAKLLAAWSGDPSPQGPSPVRALAALADLPLPQRIDCKTPEGFAFYAVYPEAYLAAALTEQWDTPPVVIGLRSIGAALAAVVAAATKAAWTTTLRPVGHPFAREVRVSASLRSRLAAHGGAFVVVDEGPGLSGSSFGAVCDLLEEVGADPRRVFLMPSHRGEPGGQASSRQLARWRGARRLVNTLDDLLAAEPMERWFSDVIGEARGSEDLSGGAWRADLPVRDRPPAWPAQERRKFRLTTASGVYLARFAGLGAIGQAKFLRARRLGAAGFSPEPLALRRGFLLERWVGGAPVDLGDLDRAALLGRMARYLAFRARSFPATRSEGASMDALRTLCLVNGAELDGAGLRRRLEARLDGFEALAPSLRPIWIDGRLQPWEWRRRPGGAMIKTDAIDHACGHDPIGCQDLAWDVAAAAAEFRLSAPETRALMTEISSLVPVGPDPRAVQAFAIVYAAYQAGYWAMAEQGAEPSERARLQRRRDLHIGDLRRAAG